MRLPACSAYAARGSSVSFIPLTSRNWGRMPNQSYCKVTLCQMAGQGSLLASMWLASPIGRSAEACMPASATCPGLAADPTRLERFLNLELTHRALLMLAEKAARRPRDQCCRLCHRDLLALRVEFPGSSYHAIVGGSRSIPVSLLLPRWPCGVPQAVRASNSLANSMGLLYAPREMSSGRALHFLGDVPL